MKMMNETDRDKLIAELTSYFRSRKETAGLYATDGANNTIEVNTPNRRVGTVSQINIRVESQVFETVWHAHDFVNSAAQNATEDVLLGEYSIND